MEMMAVLTDAGVVDDGRALDCAAAHGREAFAKFLLKHDEWRAGGDGAACLTTLRSRGQTSLTYARIVRLLVDAGVDVDDAILARTDLLLGEKKVEGEDATEEQLHSLEAIRRVLLRVDAARAFSWLLGYGRAPSRPSPTLLLWQTRAGLPTRLRARWHRCYLF